MPVDDPLNVNCIRWICGEQLMAEDLAALERVSELLRARFIRCSSRPPKNSGDWLPVLALADAELVGLSRFLRQASRTSGIAAPPETHSEILAAYRRELVSSFASFMDEIRRDLRQMADPPLPALMNWSQSRRQAGSSFRTRWPHAFVPPEKLAQAEAQAASLSEVVRDLDAIIETLEAVAAHCGCLGESLPELSDVGNVLFEADPVIAAREEPLAVAGLRLSGLAEDLEELLRGLRSDRSDFNVPEEAPASREEVS